MINIIAEIGINHNGSMELCKKMILLAKNKCKANYVKIQKRNPLLCVPKIQMSKRKNTPWGEMSYIEYKYKIEFSEEQIKELVDFSKKNNIEFYASVWDIDSAKMMSKYTKICKIGSPCITNLKLCKLCRKLFPLLIISTGMSTEEEIEICVNTCQPNVIMHTNSTYPSPVEDLNLNYIHYLKKKWGNTSQIGYSGHDTTLETTYATVGMGVKWIEKHFTLDKNMWGSDQLSSLDSNGFSKLVKGIRNIESAMKYKIGPRILFEKEKEKRKSLRKENITKNKVLFT
jgi:N-acetylneuraminate synthase